ncbi:MAG: hypothetical protein ACOC44_03185 [Promethearchaeia archaeon]
MVDEVPKRQKTTINRGVFFKKLVKIHTYNFLDYTTKRLKIFSDPQVNGARDVLYS